MPDEFAALLFCLSLYVFVPVFLAKVLLRASWRATGIAYAVWTFGLLALSLAFGLAGSFDQWAEAFGWPLILALFFTIPAIAIIVIALKIVGVK